jgi:phosphoribosylanthranilate isomerase (EC 5.3.1.24)
VLVKICGVARLADAEALDGLVEYIGFIVEPTSPRAVRPEALGALRAAVRRSRPVLVTASLPPKEAVDLAAEGEIPAVHTTARWRRRITTTPPPEGSRLRPWPCIGPGRT